MALVKLTDFGGLLPALSHRALPPGNATVAQNLVARVGEFRPLLDKTAYAGVLSLAGPKTIYRFARKAYGTLNTDPSTGWLAYAEHTNLVPSQVNGVSNSRTYLTDGVGAYAPRVIDASDANRLLGVPEPAAPTLTVNTGNYFTATERADAVRKALGDINKAITDACTPAKIGAPWTANATQGFLEDGAETGANITPIRYRVHQYSAFEGNIVEAYTVAAEADVAWLRATRLGIWAQGTGTPTWYGSGVWHYQLAYTAYGYGVRFTSATATTALTALTTEGGAALLTAAQVSEIVNKVTKIFDPDGALANPVVAPLRKAVTDFQALIDKRPQGTLTSAAASAERTEAIQAAANAIYDALARWGGSTQQGSI